MFSFRTLRPDRRLVLMAQAATLGVAVLAAQATARPAEATAQPADGDLAVVELFTSQGCSSCPPANANLVSLAQRDDVLALSWAVTYWDRLGWKDTFGDDAYTQRQRDYQRGLGTDNVWTPQVVVDGKAHVVGQIKSRIERLINAHQRFEGPLIRFRNGGVGLAGGQAPSAPADVWLVRYDARTVQVPVARGENTGRTLPHTHVVHQLVRLGDWTGSTEGYALPSSSQNGLSTAILVQAPNGGPILAAARTG